MKKFWLAFVALTMTFTVCAAQFTEGKQYETLEKPVAGEPAVLEFFSFYCPHCYQFEHVYHVPGTIRKAIPPTVKMVKYHVDFLGPLGKQLTAAWAVALALGVEDKIEEPLFDALHNKHSLNTPQDIRQVFIDAGVQASEFDAALDSFVVKSLVSKQETAARELNVKGVPAIYVNGTYLVQNGGVDTSSPDLYAARFAEVVNFLLRQKAP